MGLFTMPYSDHYNVDSHGAHGGAETVGIQSFASAGAQQIAPPNPAVSPVRRTACNAEPSGIAPQAPTPTEVFEYGGVDMPHPIASPTYKLLQQPVPETETTQAPASPACAEYLRPGAPCTASQQLLKYVRTIAYQATPIGEPDCGVVSPNNDPAALAGYIQANADINIRDSQENNEFTPLHHCAATGRLDLLELLVSFGADIDRRDFDGNKAEDIAREAAKDHVDKASKTVLLQGMHMLAQAKQAKNRNQRYGQAGYLEYATSPKTPTHGGVASGVIS